MELSYMVVWWIGGWNFNEMRDARGRSNPSFIYYQHSSLLEALHINIQLLIDSFRKPSKKNLFKLFSLNDQKFRKLCRERKIFSWNFQKLLLNEKCWKFIVSRWVCKCRRMKMNWNYLEMSKQRRKVLNYLWPKNTQTDFSNLNDTTTVRSRKSFKK